MKYIVCPVCGQEYLPAEIFLRDDLLGRPTEVVRSENGKIDFFLGEEPSFDTDFICENCGTKMFVHANLSFDVSTDQEEEYVTKFNAPDRIKLEEVDLFND